MKQVIFKKLDGWYMTPKTNYYAYVQNARQVHKLEDVNTIEDVYEMIDKMCKWYNDDPANYEFAEY